MMRASAVVVLAGSMLAACPALLGSYSYYYTDSLTSINTSNWTQNGTVTAGAGGMTSSAADGGSLISKVAVPDGSSNYEVKTTLTLVNPGGIYVTYLRASSNALEGPAPVGTAYVIEVYNPQFSGSSCTATLEGYKIVNGAVTALNQTAVPCNNGVTIRAVVSPGTYGIVAYVNNEYFYRDADTSITGGQAGIGVRSAPPGNYISQVQLGGIYTGNPVMPSPSQIGTTAFANNVEFQWPGATEPSGPGVAFYQLQRNSAWLENEDLTLEYSDPTVAPSTMYTYSIIAYDYHFNTSTVNISVTTPAAGANDPQELGIRPNGSYWGGSGEQVDMRSGNLSYFIPLIKAMSRGGWSVGFNLAYNSQNWRQDPAGTWQLGMDVGFGYGWKFLAGSLLPPIVSGTGAYLFTDATGAQYRLNQNTGGIWSSEESKYVYYDANNGLLYFNDGSFWVMGCISNGTEWDHGTMYPTTIEDSNGNQILITYAEGRQATWINSSSRPSSITDVRNGGSQTYSFTYNSDDIPHLTGITNYVGTSESYSFTYTENYALISPFGAQSYGNVALLASATSTGIPLTTYFTYDTTSATTSCSASGTGTTGPGELTQVTTPYCGHLRWTYTGANTLAGSISYREIQNRYLSMASGATEYQYTLSRANDTSYTVHSSATLVDSTANAEKYWTFQTGTSQFSLGLQTSYEELTNSTQTALQQQTFTWAQTPTSLNPYISSTVTTLNPGASYAVEKQTNQTLDQYGNMTQQQAYNFGSGGVGSLARTYTNQYSALNSNYTSRFIYNRLVSSYLTDGTNTATIASNSLDSTGLTNVTSMPNHDSNYGTSVTIRGNISTSTTLSGAATYFFDIGGNLLSTTQNGVSTSNSVTSTTNYTVPSQVTTNSLSSSMNWSSFLGLSSATGPNGDSASIVYDTNARPSTTTSPYGAVTYYTYNDTASPPNHLAMTNAHGSETIMDGFGRTTRTVTGYGTSSSITTTVSTVDAVYAPCGCSPLGKMSQTSQPYAPGGTEYWTTYTYDASGRTLTSTLPDGSQTSYVYQGNTVKVTDPAGKWKTFTMDAFGNLSSVLEPDPSLGNVTTSYTYDVLNHLTGVSMPRGTTTQTRTFNYTYSNEVGGVLLSATNPENGTVTYAYNSNMTLASKTDAKGQNFTYQYDSYNRLTSLTWTNGPNGIGGTQPQVLRTYMYDTNTITVAGTSYSSFSTFGAGRLVAVQNLPVSTLIGTSAGTVQFTEMYGYSQAGEPNAKMLQVIESPDYYPLNLTASYTYDNEGKMTSVTYPSTDPSPPPSPVAGPTYTYSFDSMHRPTGLTTGSTTLVSGVTYNADNQMLGMSTSSWGSESRTYNSLNQLTNLVVSGLASGNLNTTYNYPAGSNNGKIASQTSNLTGGETVTYQYDSLNRLISAAGTSGWGDSYSFDPFGNLTAKTVTAGSAPTLSVAVNESTNQLVGGSYDANGNPSGLSYDSENRVIGASVNASNYIQYAYDSQNKRVWSSPYASGAQSAQQVYFYGVDGSLLASYSVSISSMYSTPFNSLIESSVYFGTKRLGPQDRLGSSGTYYPWGEGKAGNNPADTWSFATYWRDSITGLDYANQRYYSNVYGRFMTPDPYTAAANGANDPANPQSWNRYAYVAGDPVNRIDLRGQFYCDPSDASCDPGCDPEDPSCNPGCNPADPGCTPEKPPFVVDVWCSITLFYRPVFGKYNHAYIFITQLVLWSNGASYYSDDVVEGLPQFSPLIPPFWWGNLQGNVFTNFVVSGDPRDTLDQPLKNRATGSISGGSNICDDAQKIEKEAARSFGWYSPTGVLGHNSNWLAGTLLGSVGLNLGTPPNAPGFP